MDVRVTESGNDDHFPDIDLYRAPRGAQIRPDACNLVAFDQDVAPRIIAHRGIHADDCASPQQDSPIAIGIGSFKKITDPLVAGRRCHGLTETCGTESADAGCGRAENLAARWPACFRSLAC